MSLVVEGALVIPLSRSWVDLPSAGDEIESRIAEIVVGYELPDERAGRRLASSLRIVTRVAHGLPPGGRRSYALILTPTAGRVEALLSIRVSRVTPEARGNYLAAATALESDERTEVVRRTVEEVRLPYGPGVLSHDFTLPHTDTGVPDPAMERTFLAVFPDSADTAVEFTLLTQNLALLADAESYLVALASGEDPFADD